MKIVRVGVDTKLCTTKTGRKYKQALTYADLIERKISDISGWTKPDAAIPIAFDMCLLKSDSFTAPGWWNGTQFESYRLASDSVIKLWKFIGDHECTGL